MNDSPINFMLYGHTPSFIDAQQSKNNLLQQKLSQMISKLNQKKQSNLQYLKQIQNQQQTIDKLKKLIKEEQKAKSTQNSLNVTKEILQNSHSFSLSELGLKHKIGCKSTQLPNKRVYLDNNNKSIESSFDGKMIEKKLKIQSYEIKRITSYGNLYNKKSFSLNKPRFK